MNEQKNLFLAIILVVGILFGFHYFYERPKAMEMAEHTAATTVSQASSDAVPEVLVSKEADILDRATALSKSGVMGKRIAIKTDKVEGSINLVGGVIDDLKLTQYHETPDQTSPSVILLSPGQTKEGYLGTMSWMHVNKDDATRFPLPGADDLWHTASTELSKDKPIVLTYSNGVGQIFERTISIDDNYMFKIDDKIINKSSDALNVKHVSMIERHDIPVSSQSGFILHEGPIGVIDKKLHEIDYADLKTQPKSRETYFTGTKRSWIGFTDKYWLTALIPNPDKEATMSFVGDDTKKIYHVLAESGSYTLAPGAEQADFVYFFAGAKVLELLDKYDEQIGFDKFDLAVDFGWFYFLTKPMLYCLQFFQTLLGNFGLGILLLTVIMKGLFFPLANKSYRSMSRMRAFTPQIQALKERYGDDKMKLNQATMELYQKEKINPMSGCLPMIIQAPIFFCLYKVLYVSLDMRHAPFYGWIKDLSTPDPTSLVNLFGLLPFDPPSFLQIGAWPIIMGLTMFMQQRLNPQPADKAQATMFLIMPFFLTFVFAGFPAGLVIYWAWSNILGIAQQWMIMRMEAKRAPILTKKK
ncbi:MAG: membrane protein insertase YidC [Alphaproteobacteria bacterium]|nr:membrane protein insertase YidC [Alphaproteobacteria bacterium]